MSQSLADSLPGNGGSGLKVWLKASAYTRRLLLGEGGDPWQGAAQFLAYFSQAQGLLRPDVAVVEVGELFDAWLAHRPEVRAELGSKRRLSYPLRKLLEQEAPRQLLAEVVEAVIANLRGQTPLEPRTRLTSHKAQRRVPAAQLGQHTGHVDALAAQPAVLAFGAVHLAHFQRCVQPHDVVDGRVECHGIDHSAASFTRVNCLYFGFGQ